MSQELDKIVNEVVKQVLGKSAPETKVNANSSNTMSKMTIDAARKTIAYVEKKAAEMGVKAVTAISDAGGNPIAVECMDDAFIAS